MFNFSVGEVLLVSMVALIALGPKQLPVIAEQLGRWLKKYRRVSNQIKVEFEQFEKQQQLTENEHRAQITDVQYEQKNK